MTGSWESLAVNSLARILNKEFSRAWRGCFSSLWLQQEEEEEEEEAPDKLQDDTKFSSSPTVLGHESPHAPGQAAVIIRQAAVNKAFPRRAVKPPGCAVAALECLGPGRLGNCVYQFDLINTAGQGCTVHVPSLNFYLTHTHTHTHITGRKVAGQNELGGGGEKECLGLFSQGFTLTVDKGTRVARWEDLDVRVNTKTQLAASSAY